MTPYSLEGDEEKIYNKQNSDLHEWCIPIRVLYYTACTSHIVFRRSQISGDYGAPHIFDRSQICVELRMHNSLPANLKSPSRVRWLPLKEVPEARFLCHRESSNSLYNRNTMFLPYLNILVGILGAVLVSQLPGFTLQYMHNLNGRLDELEPIVEELRFDIAVYNYTVETALVECDTAGGLLDAFCETFEEILIRYQELLDHYNDLESTSPYIRPFRLLKTIHQDIAESVMEEFEPAVPTSDSGLVYAGVGFLVFWVGIQVLFCACGRMCRRRRSRFDPELVDAELPKHATVSQSPRSLHQ